MEKGFVYIARIIDHGGKFVNGYHKIGLSKQYKVRETQLNSTHLPFDVLMVRVFESENMKQLEGLLHVCFEDYRVVKEYYYRKNITTEWFDVTDIDIFNERIDKFINLLNLKEIDISDSIDKDGSLSEDEKIIAKENVVNARTSKVKLTIGDKVYEGETQKSLMTKAYKYICDLVGHTKVASVDRMVALDANDFRKLLDNYSPEKTVFDNNIIFDLGGSFLWTATGVQTKKKHIDKLCKQFNITDVKFEIIS